MLSGPHSPFLQKGEGRKEGIKWETGVAVEIALRKRHSPLGLQERFCEGCQIPIAFSLGTSSSPGQSEDIGILLSDI